MKSTTVDADSVIAALRSGEWSTADLVRIAHAVARLGKNTTSILGQFGEEATARAFGGTVAPFAQKAFDVSTPNHGDLQVKTFSVGKRPGVIRSFTHDVVVVEVDPTDATVRSARLYEAADLFNAFSHAFDTKYVGLGKTWGGLQTDRFERGWTISPLLPNTDVTHMYQADIRRGTSIP